MVLKNTFLDWWIMQFSEKLWKKWEHIGTLNVWQQYQSQAIIQQKKYSENLLEIEMRKIQILMNKPLYWGLSIIKLSKIIMHEFWYDYAQPKYREKEKLCYMDTDSFTV